MKHEFSFDFVADFFFSLPFVHSFLIFTLCYIFIHSVSVYTAIGSDKRKKKRKIPNGPQKFKFATREIHCVFISFHFANRRYFRIELQMCANYFHSTACGMVDKWKIWLVCEGSQCLCMCEPLCVCVCLCINGMCFTLIEGSATEIWCVLFACLCISYEQGNNCKRCEKKKLLWIKCVPGGRVIE